LPGSPRGRQGSRPETVSRVGEGERGCRPVDTAAGVPRPAKTARQTFPQGELGTGSDRPRRRAGPLHTVLRFAAPALPAAARRSPNPSTATRSPPIPTRDKVSGRLASGGERDGHRRPSRVPLDGGLGEREALGGDAVLLHEAAL